MSDKLFSKPVLSSSKDFDQDYDIDSNGIDLDPNTESAVESIEGIEPVEDTNKLESTYEIEKSLFSTEPIADTKPIENTNTTKINVDELFDTIPLTTNNPTVNKVKTEPLEVEDIFEEEPVEIPKKEVKKAVIKTPVEPATTPSNARPTGVYEDEPKKSLRKPFILGLIGIIAIICAGWFIVNAMTSTSQTTVPEEETVIETVPEEVIEPDTSTNHNHNSYDSYDHNYNDYYDDYYDDDYYDNNYNDNYYDDSSNDYYDEPTYETPPDESIEAPSYEGTESYDNVTTDELEAYIEQLLEYYNSHQSEIHSFVDRVPRRFSRH